MHRRPIAGRWTVPGRHRAGKLSMDIDFDKRKQFLSQFAMTLGFACCLPQSALTSSMAGKGRRAYRVPDFPPVVFPDREDKQTVSDVLCVVAMLYKAKTFRSA